jgi:hypothetical protein
MRLHCDDSRFPVLKGMTMTTTTIPPTINERIAKGKNPFLKVLALSFTESQADKYIIKPIFKSSEV